MMAVLTSATAFALASGSADVSMASQCTVRVNQPAASVHLNRRDVPGRLCVRDCEALLVGAHREFDYLVGLAIYTGHRCR